MKIFGYTVSPDVAHYLLAVAAAFAGGAEGYVQQQSASTLMAALHSGPALKTIALHALGFGALAVLALAKKSFLVWTGRAGGGSAAAPVIPIRPPPPAATVPPAPPPNVVSTRGTHRTVVENCTWEADAVRGIILAASLGLCVGVAGCQGAKDPVTEVNEYVTYVQTFESGAKALFAVLAPSLGSKQADATAAFNKATALLDGAIVAAEDTAKAIADGTSATVNLPQLFADVSAAVQQVIATYDQFAGTSAPAPGLVGAATPDTVHHQAIVIAGWRP